MIPRATVQLLLRYAEVNAHMAQFDHAVGTRDDWRGLVASRKELQAALGNDIENIDRVDAGGARALLNAAVLAARGGSLDLNFEVQP